jgi:hypothetical protein
MALQDFHQDPGTTAPNSIDGPYELDVGDLTKISGGIIVIPPRYDVPDVVVIPPREVDLAPVVRSS